MFNRISGKSVAFCCFFSLVLLVPLLVASPVVNANRCDIVQLNQDYPTGANPGQTFHVTTTMDISCVQWRTYYTGRVDLVDIGSKGIFSSSPFDVGWRPYVATVANTAAAPQISGLWRLGLVVYIFKDGSIVDSMYRTFAIQVGTMNVTTSQATSTVESTTAGTTTTPTQPVVTSGTSTSVSPVASPLTLEPISAALGALVAGICAAAVALILRARKRNA